jgi:GNAT superfamily N-acetyltransferase
MMVSSLQPTESPEPGMLEAIYAALDATTAPVIGPADARPLAIPIRDDDGKIAGGLWAFTLYSWLNIQLLYVPEPLRHRKAGSTLVVLAEAEARRRGCIGALVDTFSFQAAPFYYGLGYSAFAALPDCPPGHERLYLCKRFDPSHAPRTGLAGLSRAGV